MKAVIIREHGGIDKLLYEDVEKPSAGPGEVLVKIGASGVNHLDHDLREGIAGFEVDMPLVMGVEGVGEVVEGFNLAYRQDGRYRVAHHTAAVMPPGGSGGFPRPFALPAPGEVRVIIDDAGLRIVAFQVEHEPVSPAVGYRFEYGGRSVVVSGDTKKSANLEHFAQGVDLLVHEALAPQLVGLLTQGAEQAGRKRLAKITRDILDYHASPVDAAG